ncbi:biofilm surface layer hydrophobin BslA [Bacillus sp. 179-C3.3 HS]|uniref:biofilm surface layer hydrophobin BslA n=1 Tax=Bacillus sp. 179-C3.3 HS TaxID=3232162 RepID=UPI0039A0902A
MKKMWTIVMLGMLTVVMALSAPLAASAEGTKTQEALATTNAKSAALYAKITGASKQEWSFSDLELTYRPNSVLSIGAVEFTLPTGFQATTKDLINGKALKDSYILNSGKTVRIPARIDLFGTSEYKLQLSHKVLPAAGTYTFRAENRAISIGSRFYAEDTIDINKRPVVVTPPTNPCGC